MALKGVSGGATSALDDPSAARRADRLFRRLVCQSSVPFGFADPTLPHTIRAMPEIPSLAAATLEQRTRRGALGYGPQRTPPRGRGRPPGRRAEKDEPVLRMLDPVADPLWGPTEVARALGVKYGKAYQLMITNEIPGVKRIGNRMRVRASDTTRYFDALGNEQ